MADKMILSGQNKRRADRARRAVDDYTDQTDLETTMSDLVGDLRHLADAEGIDFLQLLLRADSMYQQETAWKCKECGVTFDAEGDRDCEVDLCARCAKPHSTPREEPDRPSEPYTVLAPNEMTHKASLCNCRLVRDRESGRVNLFMCRIHKASIILEQALLQYAEYWGNLQDIDEDDQQRLLEDAQKALRMAGVKGY